MAQQDWSQELANVGPAPHLKNENPLFPPPWRTCDEPPTLATALDAAPDASAAAGTSHDWAA